MIGYLCAYLRYYHPYEFITAYLNNANDEDDVKNGSELAQLYGIRISPPRFGLSKDKYVFDKDKKIIAKGVASVKYLNAQVANDLYELSKTCSDNSFMDVLTKISESTSLNARQRDILIRIDYFQSYGNARELLRITNMFDFFKSGTAKTIKKDKLAPDLAAVIADHATDTLKNGGTAKSYTIQDMPGLLAHCEAMIRMAGVEDFDLKSKMQDQLENLGYIDLTTNREEDRKKLIVLDAFPLKSGAGQIWGYAVNAKSLGSGKTNRWTVDYLTFRKSPINKFDVIYVDRWYKNKKGYLYLTQYHRVF